MYRSRRTAAYLAGGAIAVLAAVPTHARAQADTADELHYSITPYGCMLGLSGTVGVGPVTVHRGARPSTERAMTQQWVNAIGGLRVRVAPYAKVRLLAAADAGGGGSRDTWQLYSSVGYDVWSRVTLDVAYRVLAVNYERNEFLYDTRAKGFIGGATFRSW